MKKLEKSRNIYTLPVDIALCGWICSNPRFHFGFFEKAIDFGLPTGSPIYAPAEGTVYHAVDSFGEGGPDVSLINQANVLIIDHPFREATRFVHLLKGSFKVKQGDFVRKGDLIARTGNSGYSTGPHLHFEALKRDFRFRYNWYMVDPTFEEELAIDRKKYKQSASVLASIRDLKDYRAKNNHFR